MRLWAWAQSDPGRKRERNEDSYLVDPWTGIAAVADGMGGHQGGATASRMATEMLARELAACDGDFEGSIARHVADGLRTTQPMDVVPDGDGDRDNDGGRASSHGDDGDEHRPGRDSSGDLGLFGLAPTGVSIVFSPALELMRRVARRASSAIYEASITRPELRGMGTTLTALLVSEGHAHLVHAGDSRCYLFRAGALRQVTDDHSWIAEQLRAGAISESEAKASKFRHVITRSIGFERDIDADLKTIPISDGDCFVLCSDGLSNYVELAELERLLQTSSPRALPAQLIELANSRGGDDNITVVVGVVSEAPPPA